MLRPFSFKLSPPLLCRRPFYIIYLFFLLLLFNLKVFVGADDCSINGVDEPRFGDNGSFIMELILTVLSLLLRLG